MSSVTKRNIENGICYFLVALALLFFLLPLFWMGISSLKARTDIFAMPPKWIFTPVWSNYERAMTQYNFFKYILNSLIVCLSSTALTVFIGIPASYSIARFKFRGRKSFSYWVLATQLLPLIGVVIPFFVMYRKVGLFDTHIGLIILYLTFNLGFFIWMMKGFFADIPIELEESALIDGSTHLGAFLRITLPLAAPGIAAAAILCAIFSWNEFMLAVIVTGNEARTVPVAMYMFIGTRHIEWHYLCAAGTLVTIPMVILALSVQKYIVKGLTFGVLKG